MNLQNYELGLTSYLERSFNEAHNLCVFIFVLRHAFIVHGELYYPLQ